MRSILCGECEKADETLHGVLLCSVSPDRVLHTAQLCMYRRSWVMLRARAHALQGGVLCAPPFLGFDVAADWKMSCWVFGGRRFGLVFELDFCPGLNGWLGPWLVAFLVTQQF